MIDIIFLLHFLNVMLFCSIIFLCCVDLQFAELFRGCGLWLLLFLDLLAPVFVRYVRFNWKIIYVHHRFQSCIFFYVSIMLIFIFFALIGWNLLMMVIVFLLWLDLVVLLLLLSE